jgi:hypothetical protein
MIRRNAAFVVVLTLAGCASSNGQGARHPNPASVTRQPVTITAGTVTTGPAMSPLSKGRAGEHKLMTLKH